jgi:hypothetical protein
MFRTLEDSMKRWMLVLLFVAAVASADAPPPPGPMNVPRTDAPVTLDGDLSDPAWQQAAVIDTFY